MRMVGVAMTRMKRAWMQDVGKRQIWMGTELGRGERGGLQEGVVGKYGICMEGGWNIGGNNEE